MMKSIYYLFSVKDAYFRDLSIILKEQNMFDAFYGLGYARTDALKDPLFNHVSYVSDFVGAQPVKRDVGFLEQVERQYNICISELIHTDRHLMRYDRDQRLFVAEALTRLFIEEMDKYQINVVFAEAIDDYISFFASIYCKHHGIKFFYLADVCVGPNTFLTDRVDGGPVDLEQKFAMALAAIKQGELEVKPLKEKIAAYIENKRRPAYCLDPELQYKIFNCSDLKKLWRSYKVYFQDPHGMHYDKNPLFLPYYRLKKIFYKWRYVNFISKHKITKAELKANTYFVYPLHVEPEVSTLLLARWFYDQQKIIEMISKNLPIRYTLLVKEHKGALGKRPLKYYQAINALHNVRFVAEDIDTYDLIKDSAGVITITSTMGLEALMLNKPLLCFGDRFYKVSGNVYRVEKFTEIQKAITWLLMRVFDENDALALFYVLFESALTHVEYASPSSYSLEHLNYLAEAVKTAMQ